MKKSLIILISLFMLGACSITRETPAPVINGTAPRPVANSVSPTTSTTAVASSAAATGAGTTISKASDDDGVVVSSSDTPPQPTKPVTKKKAASAVVAVAAPVAATSAALGGVNWAVPTQGKIVQAYSATTKGIDVAGKEGQPIVAADSGTVAYSGNGLKGYGNLIIIKHGNNYLTAYSHNKVNLVQEGAKVKRGQKIAELGRTESDRPLLHFELRKSGKPVDPSSIFNQ